MNALDLVVTIGASLLLLGAGALAIAALPWRREDLDSTAAAVGRVRAAVARRLRAAWTIFRQVFPVSRRPVAARSAG